MPKKPKQHGIVLSPLFEIKDPRYKVKYAKMTKEENFCANGVVCVFQDVDCAVDVLHS
jgi:hypothetical protein